MASLNKVTLMGNVGANPEIRTTTGDMKIATLSLGTKEKGFVKKDGTKIEDRTEWHRLKVFGKLAEIIEKYVRKGSPLYVEGHLHYDNYEDKDGNKKFSTEIIIDNFQFLGGNKTETNDKPQNISNENKVATGEQNDDLPF